jgi:type I restriction enzyme S subunit
MNSAVPEGWTRHKLGDSLSPRPKSKFPSGESNPLGYYDFYVCSYKVLKSFHNEYSSPSILLSTGGEASVHFATERYAFSTDVWATEFDGDICNEYVFRLLEENIGTINYSGFQGSGIKHLDKSFIEKLEFSIPPLPEQKKIASILTSVDEVIENTQKQIDKLQDLKKATMNELLTKGIGHTEFKDSELGRIPKSWEVKRLKEVTIKIRDGNYGADYPSASEMLKTGVPFLTSTVIGKNQKIDRGKLKYISREKHAQLSKAHIRTNDVLFTNRGANVGNVAVVSADLDDANIGPQLTFLRVNEHISSEYLYETLQSRNFKFQLNSLDSGSAMNFFGVGTTERLQIVVPPINEQNKIVFALSSISKTIEEKQRKLDQTQSLKKSLMQDLLTGKVRVTVN